MKAHLTRRVPLAVATYLFVALAALLLSSGMTEAANSITSPDTVGDVGSYTSLALDSSGYPVVSYFDATNGHLKLLHCDDPNCAGNESANINSPDTSANAGSFTSLALDSTGYPVVAYQGGSAQLKVLHCDDPKCAGDESGNITSPDPSVNVFRFFSLALDASDNPVVSYQDQTNSDLKVLHCDDPNCAGDESGNITWPDTLGTVGAHPSLALDCADFDPNARRCQSLPGNPVVSYGDDSSNDLKVLHCDDPKCAGDESGNISSPDTGDIVSHGTSLRLDASGYPVVVYHDDATNKLKVLHCDDAKCAGDESGNMSSPATAADGGALALDGAGNPVVSYNTGGGGHLNVLHCNDGNCTSGNSITSPDTADDVGESNSLKLDSSGNPVVSYYDDTNGDLKVLHCGNANCTEGPSGPSSVNLTLSSIQVHITNAEHFPTGVYVCDFGTSALGVYREPVIGVQGGYDYQEYQIDSFSALGSCTVGTTTVPGIGLSLVGDTSNPGVATETVNNNLGTLEFPTGPDPVTMHVQVQTPFKTLTATLVETCTYSDLEWGSCTVGQVDLYDGETSVGTIDSGTAGVTAVTDVGGIAELPEVAPHGAQPVGAPPGEGSGWSAGGYAALASGLAAAAFAIVAAAWYLRRRWVR
jgi:hypothetical protein